MVPSSASAAMRTISEFTPLEFQRGWPPLRITPNSATQSIQDKGLASAVGGAAPGGAQERHMIMLLHIEYGKAHHRPVHKGLGA